MRGHISRSGETAHIEPDFKRLSKAEQDFKKVRARIARQNAERWEFWANVDWNAMRERIQARRAGMVPLNSDDGPVL